MVTKSGHGSAASVEDLRAMVEAIAQPLIPEHVGVVVGATTGIARVVSAFAGRGQAEPRAGAIFQIGSVTKVFTALALADAFTSGELSLDTPLASLLSTPMRPLHRRHELADRYVQAHSRGGKPVPDREHELSRLAAGARSGGRAARQLWSLGGRSRPSTRPSPAGT